MSLADFSLAVMERIGVCDQCLARVRRSPGRDLGDVLCDQCLAKLDGYIAALRGGHPGARKLAQDLLEHE